ncbi:adenylate/guanylate cyclase domain-containing protein [Microvirga sp. 3-52]|uniref:adenylate/guanylate cyclase domain-containing protein n=1 Tax=Microvirga sp. 3-52 TaxID=2792425 RepID=UPI001AD1ADDC|nr:adenylate/guanylate cyclase domain-containing protein [Microvirga sp. 3-52]MBO1906333.1 adenylate/guanylate cyclase domain-containing protein [Microvirga sp. 3-52]MBS7453495.1 adenylate/guanylate cyclase domain-containing protein [Microvirga sp. 3-52]
MDRQEHKVERRLAAIFAADVAGYSRLMERDEVGTLQTLSSRRKIMDRLIAHHRGRIANTAGDSVLAEFPSVVDAVQCAVAVQEALAYANQDARVERRLVFRIGIHVGDVMVQGCDLLGDGVNIAARLQSIADPGGICISESAYGYVRKVVPVGFTELGPQKVKNIEEPIRAFAVTLTKVAPPSTQATPAKALSPPDKPSIAVLPFTNMNGDPEQDHFAEGITEDIITELSRISAFFIIARNSTFTYKGTNPDVRQVGRELGVQYVVEGSVRRSGERVRVNVHLLEASTGNHIWGDRYDRPLADLFDVQDDITRSIVASTQTQVVLNEGLIAERHEHPDFHTWDMAKRGWRNIYQLSRESLERAREIGLAIKRHDPASPKGPQIVATATYHLVYMGFASDPDAMRQEAIAEAREAMRLDDRDEYTQWTYGNVLMGLLGRREDAISAYEQALEINPNFSLAYGSLGTTLAWQGRSDESIRTVEIAIRLNPRDPSIFFRYTALAVAYYSKQDYQSARDWAQHSVARRANWWIGWALLAASHAQLKDIAAAQAALSGLLEVLPNRRISTLPFPPLGEEQITHLREGLKMAGLPE